MKVFEVWIRTYDNLRCEYRTDTWIGIFSSKEKAENIGLDAFRNVLTNSIKIERVNKRGEPLKHNIYAEFDDCRFELCIDESELDQRYDLVRPE